MNTKKEPWLLVGLAVGLVVIWQLPGGHYFIYPFTILSTWFHEMGHGLMAWLLGGKFLQLEIYQNGSGLAVYTLPVTASRLTHGLIALAGPIGPASAGGLFILASSHPKRSRILLVILGVALLLSCLIWVRSIYGILVIPLMGSLVLWVAHKCSVKVSHFVVNLVGVQAAMSLYQHVDYFFTESVTIVGNIMLSDTGQMEQAFWLPHWFWAIVAILFSIATLTLSIWVAYRN
ncbi:M50 family metallopeptidase [Coraliomargarita sp. SDUM461003]|uniref:M50 family metallopeptidase n=1 Tax=Thalassobacterium maritimum TaxID=3041265 RepID=A0ABU1AUV5_9BACT|nr:M50 family metallopeptidase [Coraliomargarita sp. SDUM461003]MDQ8207873.1 M50 family metallopeptidase [Coraliomargarita sp. SDUM461003]